jgi:hypothetical protein
MTENIDLRREEKENLQYRDLFVCEKSTDLISQN